MQQGRRQVDITVLELDRTLAASMRKKKLKLIQEMLENYHFQQFVGLARGADRLANEHLAQAIVEAGWNNVSATPPYQKVCGDYRTATQRTSIMTPHPVLLAGVFIVPPSTSSHVQKTALDALQKILANSRAPWYHSK